MKKVVLLLACSWFCLGQISGQSFFQFYFYGNGVRHDALMSIENDDNIDVWVKYYDSDLGRYVVVHQDASAVSGQGGVAILCENPVYDGTNRSAYYNADNFFIINRGYGNYELYNIDDDNAYSKVYGLKELKTKADLVRAYVQFAN